MEIILGDGKANTTSFISWRRLEEQLKKSGEIRQSEYLDKVEIDTDGMTYYVHSDTISRKLQTQSAN